MTKEFKWGIENKCGVIGCDKQINWGEFTSWLACENHHNRKWGQCEACQSKKTTHTVYYNIYHGNNKAEQALKEVSEGISFQKEIIEKFFSKNISSSLREKLNAAYQKAQEAEKIIPKLERLAKEHWEKELNCASDLILEKGGQQTNVYESNLCDSCGNEANDRQQKLKNDYRLNVLDKLIVFNPETNNQIEKEIGRDEAQEIAYGLICNNEKIQGDDRFQVRYHFLGKLPFFKNKKTVEQNQKKKANFQKLKQFFQDNQIMQIVEKGGFEYIIWYVNGNIEEKSSSQLAEWGKLRSCFFHYSVRGLSLHEINNVLTRLEQEPTPNEKEEETLLNENNEKEKNKNLLLDLEKELIKSYFSKHKIRKIAFKDGSLVVTYNDNKIITDKQLTNNSEYWLLKNSLQKLNKNELSSQELGINSENVSTNTANSPSGNNYFWLVGAITLGVIVVGLLVFFFQPKKRKIN